MANTTEKFIAFIDILGFKDLVSRYTHQEVLEKLESISGWINYIKEVNKGEMVKIMYGDEELKPFIFSDSIVIFTKTNTLNAGKLLLYACDYLFGKAIESHIPIKGAISYGAITIDEEKSIFFGQPIIDAFLLQEELKYYGLILHHTAESQLYKIGNDKSLLDHLLTKEKTPTKSGNISYYNLIYKLPLTVKPEQSCLETLYNFVSGSPRIYVDNTVEMFKKIKPKADL